MNARSLCIQQIMRLGFFMLRLDISDVLLVCFHDRYRKRLGEQRHDCKMVIRSGDVDGLPSSGLGVGIDTSCQQPHHHFQVAVLACHEQWCRTIVHRCIDVGTSC